MAEPAISREQLEGVWAEVLLAFGCCACTCHHDLRPDPRAIASLRDLFEQTVADALAELGIEDWEKGGGREYVLDRVCKIAKLASTLAARSNTSRAISGDDVREAAGLVIRHARQVIERWQAWQERRGRVAEGHGDRQPSDPRVELVSDAGQSGEPDPKVAFGRYCTNYSG
jgi:hypothetical protein